MASAPLPLSRLVGLVMAVVAVGVVVSRNTLETGSSTRTNPLELFLTTTETQPLFIVGVVAAVVGILAVVRFRV
ncbi:hypothetical protein [Haloferax sp. DFSO60]|uniref:hypothetical protein n=1 Tax=Haloferax sp. DFSO60 TaxID=3388652 RepID=UPI003978FC0F